MSPASARDRLDVVGLIMADRAFLDSQAEGTTVAESVRAALRAYIEETATPQEDAPAMRQTVHQMPDGGEVLVRTHDDYETVLVMTRAGQLHSWGPPVTGVQA